MNSKTLQAKLSTFIAAAAEVPRLETFFADKKSRLAELEQIADVFDSKALAEIGVLQTVAQLEPRRLEAARAGFGVAEAALSEANEEFARNAFHPRAKTIREHVAKKMAAQISAHFSDEGSLGEAAAKSSAMQSLEAIAARGVVGGNDIYRVRECAERLLKAWGELEEFEKNHCK